MSHTLDFPDCVLCVISSLLISSMFPIIEAPSQVLFCVSCCMSAGSPTINDAHPGSMGKVAATWSFHPKDLLSFSELVIKM